jgi:hypothetical protein
MLTNDLYLTIWRFIFEKHQKRLYDRELRRLRELARREPSFAEEEGIIVFPDIIVHRRETEDNLLVIELKKSSSGVKKDFDYAKLQGYKSELSYRFAMFICLGTKNESSPIVECEFIGLSSAAREKVAERI